MTNPIKPEDNLVENQHLEAALAQMSETELARLLHYVEALHTDLARLSLPDDESIGIVTDTRHLLGILMDKVRRSVSLQQGKDAYDGLHAWDNEGGTVPHAASRRLLSRMVEGERRLVWADAEGVGEK